MNRLHQYQRLDNNSMKILFIGKRHYTNRDALSERYGRIYQLPLHWSRQGLNVSLWLIDYHTHTGEVTSDDRLRVESTPIVSVNFLRRLANELLFTQSRHDLVVASGDCYIGLMARRIARRQRAHFVFDIYDKYDEFSGYRKTPWFDPFSTLIKSADARLFASSALMTALQRAPEDCLVPNGIDTTRFKPAGMETSRAAMDLPQGTLLVGYFGSMEPDRGVADLIDAVTLLRERGMAVHILLGGKALSDHSINREGVIYLGNVPYEKMPTALSACDLLAIPYRRSAFMDAGASNKIAEAIACRRPVVATRTPNLVDNFPEQALQLESVLAEPGNVESLAMSIVRQAEQRILVDMPPGMSWPEISTMALDRLATLDTSCTRQPDSRMS